MAPRSRSKPKVPLDCDGVRLKVGDPVENTPRHSDERHTGKVVGVVRALIEVKHDGCCHEPKNPSGVWRSAAFLWRKRSV